MDLKKELEKIALGKTVERTLSVNSNGSYSLRYTTGKANIEAIKVLLDLENRDEVLKDNTEVLASIILNSGGE